MAAGLPAAAPGIPRAFTVRTVVAVEDVETESTRGRILQRLDLVARTHDETAAVADEVVVVARPSAIS